MSAIGPVEESIRSKAIQARRRLMSAGNNNVRLAKAVTIITSRNVVRISPDVPLPGPSTRRERPIPGPKNVYLSDAAAKKARSIIAFVARRHSVSVAAIHSKQRFTHIVRARHEAYYRLLTEVALSSPEVARVFGRDRSGIMDGARMHAKLNGKAMP